MTQRILLMGTIDSGALALGAYYTSWVTTISILKRLGYDLHIITPPDASDFFSAPRFNADDYDFICYPHIGPVGSVGGAGEAFIYPFEDDTNLGTLPVLVFSCIGNGFVDAALGTSNQVATNADYKMQTYATATNPFPDDFYCYARPRDYGVGTNITKYLSRADEADHITVWKYEPANRPVVYASSLLNSAGTCSVGVPMLLQIAINEGAIPHTPNKLTSIHDIDDCPSVNMAESDCHLVYGHMERGNIPITWGMKLGIAGQGNGNTDFVNISDEKWDFVAARTPDKGGLIYPCCHNHNWLWDKSQAGVTTKEELDTNYRGDVARAQSAGTIGGITMGSDADELNSWEYIFTPLNYIADSNEDESMQLMSPQFANASDPANTVAQYGYGIKNLRMFMDQSTAPPGVRYRPPNDAPFAATAGCSGYTHRGIRIIPAQYAIVDDVAVADPTTDTDGYVQRLSQMTYKWVTHGMGYGCSLFFHGSNCVTSTGKDLGIIWLGVLADWGLFFKDVHKFIHPSQIRTNKRSL